MIKLHKIGGIVVNDPYKFGSSAVWRHRSAAKSTQNYRFSKMDFLLSGLKKIKKKKLSKHNVKTTTTTKKRAREYRE